MLRFYLIESEQVARCLIEIVGLVVTVVVFAPLIVSVAPVFYVTALAQIGLHSASVVVIVVAACHIVVADGCNVAGVALVKDVVV